MRLENNIYPLKRYIFGVDDAAFATGAAAVIGAGTSAVAQGSMNRKTRKFNREEAEKQRQWSEKMYNEQNAWNYEMWQKQNEYNSPEAQVQRMRDAGLNPLYFGLDGTGNAASIQAAQPLSYERAKADNQINPFGTGLAAAQELANVQLTQAQASKTKSETKMIDAKLPYEVESLKTQVRQSKLDADAQEIINKYLDQQQDAELRVKESTIAANDKTVEKAAAEIEKMDYEKTTMYIGWLETQERILTLQKNRDLTDKQMEELSSLISKNYAEAKKIGLDVSNYDDITVIGTASHTMRIGPFTVQEGEPITLAMKKAAEEHAKNLQKESKKNKKSPEGQVSTADGSPYNGPIYD